jgi:hypothetical protein
MKRSGTALTSALLIGVLVGGCGRENTVACDATDRYAAASSAPPVRIPDDLSPPDESDSLRLPPETGATTAALTRPCLETPPGFFAEGAPGGTRLGNPPGTPAPAAAPAPPSAAPAPPATPPANDERQISN